eukprot:scaffold5466_cov108-Isochrysis_galbana.AAC.4
MTRQTHTCLQQQIDDGQEYGVRSDLECRLLNFCTQEAVTLRAELAHENSDSSGRIEGDLRVDSDGAAVVVDADLSAKEQEGERSGPCWPVAGASGRPGSAAAARSWPRRTALSWGGGRRACSRRRRRAARLKLGIRQLHLGDIRVQPRAHKRSDQIDLVHLPDPGHHAAGRLSGRARQPNGAQRAGQLRAEAVQLVHAIGGQKVSVGEAASRASPAAAELRRPTLVRPEQRELIRLLRAKVRPRRVCLRALLHRGQEGRTRERHGCCDGEHRVDAAEQGAKEEHLAHAQVERHACEMLTQGGESVQRTHACGTSWLARGIRYRTSGGAWAGSGHNGTDTQQRGLGCVDGVLRGRLQRAQEEGARVAACDAERLDLQEEVVEGHTRHLWSDGGRQPLQLSAGIERPVFPLRGAAGAATALPTRG